MHPTATRKPAMFTREQVEFYENLATVSIRRLFPMRLRMDALAGSRINDRLLFPRFKRNNRPSFPPCVNINISNALFGTGSTNGNLLSLSRRKARQMLSCSRFSNPDIPDAQ